MPGSGVRPIDGEVGAKIQAPGKPTRGLLFVFFVPALSRNPDTLIAKGLGRLNAGLLERRIIKSWPQKFYTSIAHTDDDVGETIAAIQAVVPCGVSYQLSLE